jgi:seryl-tRNA synthetase
MEGTGFFPHGRDQAYLIEETARGGGQDLYLTGTGEVGLMGLHQDEILDEASLPIQYVTVSTCFRREAGAAGKDTAGLYRIHQFDKVEQVVICKADEAESRAWHQKMIGFVESICKDLGLPLPAAAVLHGRPGPEERGHGRHRVLDARARRAWVRTACRGRFRGDALGEPAVRLPVPTAEHAVPGRG